MKIPPPVDVAVGAEREVLNPTTGEVEFTVLGASAEGAAELFQLARAASPEWAGRPLAQRADALAGAAAALEADGTGPELMVSDVGKPLGEAKAEWKRAADILRYVASLARVETGAVFEDASGAPIRSLRGPLGTVLLVTPWNFPAAIPVWKLAPALLAGNAVCLKPATQGARICATLLESLYAAGVPRQACVLVPGGAEAVDGMLGERPDALSFTGSTAVGRLLVGRCGGELIPVQAELGGKNVTYVGADADPELAASIVLAGSMGYAGQKCTATSVALVAERMRRPVREAIESALPEWRVGNPGEATTTIGPVVSQGDRDRIGAAVEEAVGRGVELVGEGPLSAGCSHAGYPATLLATEADDPLFREEIFGPVLGLRPVTDLDAALAWMRGLDEGLAGGIVSSDIDEVRRFAEQAPVGVVRVNAPTTGLEPHVPFGGVGASGFGPREQGRTGLEFFSAPKTVYGW